MKTVSDIVPQTSNNGQDETRCAEDKRVPSSARDGSLSLTGLWEFLVRNKRIPEDLNLDALFATINHRLRDPEWVVRQHALRVLVDFLPLVDKEALDTKVETILNELVTNLGHVGPAVRKGAVDALRVYLNHSEKSNKILKGLIFKGVEQPQVNKIAQNVSVGLIIAIPFVINQKISNETIKYAIHTLLGKLEQPNHQESILTSLLRIKGIVGAKRFNEVLDCHASKRAFEMLRDLYNLPEPSLILSAGDMFCAKDSKQFWNDHNQNLVNTDTDAVVDKVILETEIKLDAGPAITMKIHEESRQNSTNETSDSEEETRGVKTFKILTDSDDDYELLRRTPRRVRFGGEIVKMRTPDSDSNHQSDDDPTLSIITEDKAPVVEILYKKTTKIVKKSHIPVPVNSKARSTRSEPNSPKKMKTSSKLYKSSPDLRRKDCGAISEDKTKRKSKIPMRAESEKKAKDPVKNIKTKVEIPTSKEEEKKKITKNAAKVETKKIEGSEKKLLAVEYQPAKKLSVSPTPDRNKLKINTKTPMARRNSRELDQYSPIPVHNEIEVFHNLTRSPERKPANSRKEVPHIPSSDRHLITADQVLLPKLHEAEENRRIQTADLAEKSTHKTTNNQLVFINNYNSFHVYNSDSNRQRLDYCDSPIPTRDTGECLTCSSSGSDALADKNGYENLDELGERILLDIQNRDDIRVKQRGLEELLKMLKDPAMLESIEERLSFILQLLFSSEQQPFLQSISEQNLSYIFSNIREEILINKLHHIALYLSKTGSPVGVRLALLILKRISAKLLIDHLLSDSILAAKSSKIREGALQILMSISRIYPSTEVDVSKCVDRIVPVLKDRKRKVRQAALEALAALTQLSSTSIVLEVVTKMIADYPDREQIMTVVRTRLSRKQLPAVDLNGNVRYSTPSGETEIEWLARGANGTPNSDGGHQRAFSATYRKIEELSGDHSNGEKANYWRTKPKELQRTPPEVSTTFSEDIDSDWSRDSKDESSGKASSATQIWAIDSGVFAPSPEKLSNFNGATLRPVYVIQSTESQSSNLSTDSQINNKTHKQTNTDHHHHKVVREQRGRSFSPPKHLRESYNNHDRFVQADGSRESNFYARNSRFHKSFSSDQLVPENNTRQANSLSSGSSSTNSGSSFRIGVWNKDVRSGIPVAISSDSRFRVRTKYNEVNKGPMSTTQFFGPKLQTPEPTPEKYSSPPRPVMARQPFSSGSESSGYFTPPAEPHLPETNNFDQNQPNGERSMANSQRSSGRSENSTASGNRFVRPSGTPLSASSSLRHQENFTVIDSNYCESLKSRSAASQRAVYAESRFESTDYAESREELESSKDPEVEQESLEEVPIKDDDDSKEHIITEEEYIETEEKNVIRKQSTTASLEDLDFVANQVFGERNHLCKSESDIKSNIDARRKTVSSAPSLNDTSFDNFEKFTPASSKTSLPGSILDFQEIEVVQEVIEKTPDKTICKKTVTRQLSRKRSCRMPRTAEKTPTQEATRPFTRPKEALHETLAQLDSPEWEITVKGLQNLMRLIKHHNGIVEQNVHAICVGLGKHVRNLRSQVARSACLAALELFRTCKKALEPDVEELATPLLHRTADTNKFLRSDANEALDEMSTQLSPPKVVSVITSKGANHQNAIVRCAAMRLLCSLCHRLGPEKVFQLPKDTRDKILVTGANMLMEGSLETRKHAKMMLGYLSTHCQFQRAMLEAVPSHVMRHISKTLKTLT